MPHAKKIKYEASQLSLEYFGLCLNLYRQELEMKNNYDKKGIYISTHKDQHHQYTYTIINASVFHFTL